MENVSKDHCAATHRQMDERFQRDKERIESLEELTRQMSEMTMELREINRRHESEITETKCDVKSLKDRSGRRWEGLVDKLITAAGSGLVGYFLARIGLG